MLTFNGVHKSFGEHAVLQGIDFQLEAGTTYALLGRNGAGKTTLLQLALDLLAPDAGTIYIQGHPVHDLPPSMKRQMGVVSEPTMLLDELSGRDLLRFSAELYKLPSEEAAQRIDGLIQYFFPEEEDSLDRLVGDYSTGMRKKIALCAAVLHRPPLLLLDEPFSGLDPSAARRVVQFIRRYQNGSRALLFSSHALNYVESTATHIAVLHEGSIAFDDTVARFLDDGAQQLETHLLQMLGAGATEEELQQLDWL